MLYQQTGLFIHLNAQDSLDQVSEQFSRETCQIYKSNIFATLTKLEKDCRILNSNIKVGTMYKKLIRRGDSERELSLQRHHTRSTK